MRINRITENSVFVVVIGFFLNVCLFVSMNNKLEEKKKKKLRFIYLEFWMMKETKKIKD